MSNRPLGKDLLDGQSQDYVALAIKRHIEEVDAKKDDENALPRIIGVEGSWGSGKSNMLLQLQEKLKSNYYFFTYDAWGNQEDLQRRSILESLTDELIQKEMLVKDTQIKVLDTDLDKEPTIMRCSYGGLYQGVRLNAIDHSNCTNIDGRNETSKCTVLVSMGSIGSNTISILCVFDL